MAAVGEAAPIMAARKQYSRAVSGAHIKRLTLGPTLQTVAHKAVFLPADMSLAHEVAKQSRYGPLQCNVADADRERHTGSLVSVESGCRIALQIQFNLLSNDSLTENFIGFWQFKMSEKTCILTF